MRTTAATCELIHACVRDDKERDKGADKTKATADRERRCVPSHLWGRKELKTKQQDHLTPPGHKEHLNNTCFLFRITRPGQLCR